MGMPSISNFLSCGMWHQPVVHVVGSGPTTRGLTRMSWSVQVRLVSNLGFEGFLRPCS